jgi:hypothetical protein
MRKLALLFGLIAGAIGFVLRFGTHKPAGTTTAGRAGSIRCPTSTTSP